MAFVELGLTAFDKITDRYHDSAFDGARNFGRKLTKKKKVTRETRGGRERASSQPAVREEVEEIEYERPRELTEEDWEVVDDQPGPHGRGVNPQKEQRRGTMAGEYGRNGSADYGRPSSVDYGRNGGADYGYNDQRYPPVNNYPAEPQARGPEQGYSQDHRNEMRNYDPAYAAAAGGYAAQQQPPNPRKSYDDYRYTDRYSYDESPPRSSGRDYDRGRRDRKSTKDSARSKSRKRSPSKLRRTLDENFDTTEKGAAAGIAGALVGGLAGKKYGDDSLLATLAGAVVGGIGANALEYQWKKHKDEKDGKRKDRYEPQAYGIDGDGYDKYERRRRRSR
ncbi:MAG: hypothetical protein M1820_004367 [Bogoriella megaspora]|nr:MAG: hypothetical protein M1820_004367 [Bogoriella megaspora]